MKVSLLNPKDNVTIACDVDPDTTISNLLPYVTEYYGESYNVRFVYAGKVLEHETKINAFEYTEGNPIYLVLGEKIVKPALAEYEVTYDGKQVLSACQNNGNVMFKIIADLACRNPYFLSYLAVDPAKAKQYLYETVESEDFSLTVKGKTVEDDPVAVSNKHLCGDNGYQIDERNVKFIMKLSGNEDVEYEEAKEYYLFYERDIMRTCAKLKNL